MIIDGIVGELYRMVTHTAFYLFLLTCLLGLFMALKRHTNVKGLVVIKIGLAVYFYGWLLEVIADELFHKGFLHANGIADIKWRLVRCSNLMESAAIFLRVLSGGALVSWSLWLLSKMFLRTNVTERKSNESCLNC